MTRASNSPKSSLVDWDSSFDLEATQTQIDDLLARQELDDLLYAGAPSEVMTTKASPPPSVALRAWLSEWDPEAAQQEVERIMGLPSEDANPNEKRVFYRIPTSVMEAKLSSNAKLVYGVLASEHRGGEGVGPTREQLSKETALSLSQVKTALGALRQRALIEADQPQPKRPNHFILVDWKKKQEEDFTCVPKWLAQRSEVGAGAKLLYGVISNGVGYGSSHHEPYSAGEKKLAEKMGAASRTVRRYVDKLEAWGLIRVERARGKAGEHLVNRYSLRRHQWWMVNAKFYDRPEDPKRPLPEDPEGSLLEDREAPLPEAPNRPLLRTSSKTSSSEHHAGGVTEEEGSDFGDSEGSSETNSNPKPVSPPTGRAPSSPAPSPDADLLAEWMAFLQEAVQRGLSDIKRQRDYARTRVEVDAVPPPMTAADWDAAHVLVGAADQALRSRLVRPWPDCLDGLAEAGRKWRLFCGRHPEAADYMAATLDAMPRFENEQLAEVLQAIARNPAMFGEALALHESETGSPFDLRRDAFRRLAQEATPKKQKAFVQAWKEGDRVFLAEHVDRVMEQEKQKKAMDEDELKIERVAAQPIKQGRWPYEGERDQSDEERRQCPAQTRDEDEEEEEEEQEADLSAAVRRLRRVLNDD